MQTANHYERCWHIILKSQDIYVINNLNISHYSFPYIVQIRFFKELECDFCLLETCLQLYHSKIHVLH